MPALWQHKCLSSKKNNLRKGTRWSHQTKPTGFLLRNHGAHCSLRFHRMRGHEKQLWNAEGSALHSTIFLNQKVRNKQWWCAETTSSFCRGDASRAQKDANISTKSATKPSSGFALKDIKNSIFQLPLNSCVLIKNVIWPVKSAGSCILCYSALENEKNGTWFAESRWATRSGCDMCHNHISRRLKSNQFHAWGWQRWAGTSSQSPLPCGQKAVPNLSNARQVAASWAHRLLTLFIRLQGSA